MTADQYQARLWQEMTWPEIGEMAEADAMVILPIAALEQHGPHLPVDTDTNVAWEIAVRAAEQISEFPVLTAPVVWTGYSPHHMAYPGTLTLSADTLIRVTVELCESLTRHGFWRIVILNGHGGNEPVLNTAATEVATGLGVRVPVVTWWGPFAPRMTDLLQSEIGGSNHSGEIETALQLYLRPELVRTGEMVTELAGSRGSFLRTDYRATGPGGVFLPADFGQDTDFGVQGDPTLATAELGAEILELVVSQLARFLREFWDLSGTWKRMGTGRGGE